MTDPDTPKSPEQNSASAAKSTQQLTVGEPENLNSTQRLERTDPALATGKLTITPAPSDSQGLPLLVPARWDATHEGAIAPVKADPKPPQALPGGGWKLPLLIGSLVVVGATAYLVFYRGRTAPAPVAATAAQPAPVPEAAKLYLEQAQAGDAHAMRMLGVMYYYGLNVPQDREKGLLWYRKAAEKGSEAAREELRKLESGS